MLVSGRRFEVRIRGELPAGWPLNDAQTVGWLNTSLSTALNLASLIKESQVHLSPPGDAGPRGPVAA